MCTYAGDAINGQGPVRSASYQNKLNKINLSDLKNMPIFVVNQRSKRFSSVVKGI